MKCVDNPSSHQMVEDELNKALVERTGAKLKINLIESGAWTEKMNVIINSGEAFDITQTSSTGSTSVYRNAKTDAFMDVKDLLNQYGQDILEKQDKRVWDAVTFDGKIIAIPSQSKYVDDYVAVFKKDLVDKYNFDYSSVKSWDDLEPYLEIIKQNEPGITPLLITASLDMNDPDFSHFTVTTVPLVRFDEEKEIFVDDLEAREAMYARRRKYYEKGYIAKDANINQESTEGQTGKYAVMNDSGAYSEDGSKSSAYYGFPCVESLLGVSSSIAPQRIVNGVAIGGSSKHPAEAVKILNEIWKDPYLSNTMAYGIEGIDYTVASGTTNEDKTVIPKTGSERTWCIWNNLVGPLFDQWDSSWNSRESLARMQHYNGITPASKLLGFVPDTDAFTAEIAALTQVDSASKIVLRTGCMEDYDTYIADYKQKMIDAGVERIVDELNKQYIDWKNNK